MKAFLLAFLMIGFSSACPAEVADVGPGTVQLLNGYSHTPHQGKDSHPGEIISADGKLTIHYDIGGMAGTYMHAGQKEKCIWYREQIIGGHKVCSGLLKNGAGRDLVVTIHKGGGAKDEAWHYPANFTAQVRSDEEIADVLLTVLSYQGKDDKVTR